MKIKIDKSSSKAITLITLVITILVLLILTGITLNIAINNSGIISKTSNSSQNFIYDNVYEELNSIILTAQAENIRNEPTLTNVVSYLLEDTENEYILSSSSRADDSENVGDIQTANDVGDKTEVFIIFKDYEFKLDDNLKLHKLDIYYASIDIDNNEDNNNDENDDYDDINTDGLVLHLNGIKNTSSEHSSSTDTWYDLTEFSNNATKTTGTTSWSSNSLILDGSTYYTVPAPVNDSLGTAEICAKIDSNFSPINTNNWYDCSTIFGCEMGGAQKDWAIIIDKNGYFAIGYDWSTIYASNIYAIDGNLHTIAYTYLSNKLVFSIDGQIITTINYSPAGNAFTHLGIGWNNASASTAIKGEIYDIKFYNKELNSTELAQQHAKNIIAYPQPTIDTSNYVLANLKMHLDGINNTSSGHSSSTDTWYDSTTNEKNATKTAGTSSWASNSLTLDGSTYYTVTAPVNDSFGTAEICVKIDSSFTPANAYNWYQCSTIFGCELSSTQKDWAIIIDRNGYFAIGYDTSTIYSSTINALDNQIHTISYSYMSNRIIFTIDGTVIAHIPFTPYGNACTQFGIGWNKDNPNTTIRGQIYDVRFYDTCLTYNEKYINHIVDQNRYSN